MLSAELKTKIDWLLAVGLTSAPMLAGGVGTGGPRKRDTPA